MNPRSTTTFDATAGNRLRTLRLSRKMSQEKLGDHLALTFQQIQKYEKGTNRISTDRIHKIADVFEVPVDYFYPNRPANGAAVTAPSPIDRFMATKEGITVANALIRIADPIVRAKVVAAVEALSEAACAVGPPRFDLAAQVRTLGADSLLPPAKKGKAS